MFGSLIQPFDHYWKDTVLLARMNGLDTGTTFIDERGHAMTAQNNAQTSTAQSKWNGSSYLSDGSGDAVTIPDHNDYELGSGDFTIECWIRYSNAIGTSTIVQKGQTYNSNASFRFYNTSTQLIFKFSTTGSTYSAYTVQGNHGMVIDTWYHVAITRISGSGRIFVDGVLKAGPSTISDAFYNYTGPVIIGSNYTGTYTETLDGYMQDLRITKGKGRYSAAFTAPKQPFPNA